VRGGQEALNHGLGDERPSSVAALADTAAELGSVTEVVHTAGLSPVQAPADAILNVDLLGVALVLEEFVRVIAPGEAGVVISSMAGHMAAPLLDASQEQALAHTHGDALPGLAFLGPEAAGGNSYGLSKRANQLRVQAASGPWGERGARINSISPGVISTPMGRRELASENGTSMRAMIDASPARRLGTPGDIAGRQRSCSARFPPSSPAPTCSSTVASSRPSIPAG
jgi:NAD(P)-dependent dehydrogenase (short-subunit alcohol dehydrogenase family)